MKLSIYLLIPFILLSSCSNELDYVEHADTSTHTYEVQESNAAIEAKYIEAENINENVIGWINCDDLNIDYPILKSKDNFDYLRTDLYGNYSISGSIFLDRNTKENPNWKLIHGHNMGDNTMFSSLPTFLNSNEYKSSIFNIYMEECGYSKYIVISAFSIDATVENIIPMTVLDIVDLNTLISQYIDRSNIKYYDSFITDSLIVLDTCWYPTEDSERQHSITILGRMI